MAQELNKRGWGPGKRLLCIYTKQADCVIVQQALTVHNTVVIHAITVWQLDAPMGLAVAVVVEAVVLEANQQRARPVWPLARRAVLRRG